MTEWTTEKAYLDIDTYIAELSPGGALSLTNDHTKEELDLSPRGSYDLLVFLHRHAAQIYQAAREPKEVFPYEEHHLTIIRPSSSNEGEAGKPKEQDRMLYGDASDPLLLFVHDLVAAWGERAYNGPAIVTRIDSVPFAEEQREPEELEILRGLRNWDTPEGTPTQAWKCTVWPQWDYKNFMGNHVYVHRYGDQLWTAHSEWQSGPPHFLWLEDEE
jgi:hypothetical protein